ncbi:hypothetical protein [Curtobacterium sp. MCSS17_007]|uniref:hypothetical protein n=1 Tax=Curtobacterium sp. MCSS17_007 TaxID=2175646 RepID=UPI000DA7186D|nr:hypothetical protein [Curtobacterium sp. MCSS17_007]WIE74951.1 hypothetical protein DEJ22_011885 [Curtobacterium sp. MCSS17_007]
MTLVRAPRWERILTVVVLGPLVICTGIALLSVVFIPGSSARATVGALGALLVITGSVLSVRASRVGVRLSDDELRYDGFLVSWRAPRDGITTVLDDGSVEWRDDRGAGQRRQIWLLTQAWEDDGTRFAQLWRWRREGLLRVRDWAAARAV